MEVVRVGFVGLGMRGPGAVERFTYIPGTQLWPFVIMKHPVQKNVRIS